MASLLRGKHHKPRELACSQYYFCRNVFTRDDRDVGKPPILMVRTERWKPSHLDWERCELFALKKGPGEFEIAWTMQAARESSASWIAAARRMYSA